MPFFAEQAKLYKTPASLGTVVASLRGYFRWRSSQGSHTHALQGAVSYGANWQLSSLPQSLHPAEIEQLVAALGHPGASMRRADAMVRCALDLGLRIGEIARLDLDDIDWDAGTVTLRRTKGRRADVLPLPATTGNAIVAYLRNERPKTAHRRIFASHKAPRERLHMRGRGGQDDPRSVRQGGSAIHARTPAAAHHGQPPLGWRLAAQGSRRRLASSIAEHYVDLRQARQPTPAAGCSTLAWVAKLLQLGEEAMNPRLTDLVESYLAERRRLGFELRSAAYSLRSFAQYVARSSHCAPLTAELMTRWAREECRGGGELRAWAKRLRQLRPFARWLLQFEPQTEVPDDTVLGRRPRRGTPHIYSGAEVADLLSASRRLVPRSGLRPLVYETLFGLIASAGLRVSEALALCIRDVDLQQGVLTIRLTKFGKSRAVPLHPSTTDALRAYQVRRDLAGASTLDDQPFFISTRVDVFGQPLAGHQVRLVFAGLRRELGWANRGTHHAPRIHDLRHTFVVRRVQLWQQDGIDVDQALLSLSTYVGHANITDTYWYMQAVPELMATAARSFEACMPSETHHA